MTIWVPDLTRYDGPRYQAIAEAIGDAIVAGDLGEGVKLPPQRDLAWRLGVTVGTVSRAYMLAESRGFVSGEVGRGTYVRAGAGKAGGYVLDPPPSDNLVDLGKNFPGPLIGGLEGALRSTFAELSQREGLEQLVQYMPDVGHAAHRAAAAKWCERVGLKASPDQVVLAAGGQQALMASLMALARSGDMVLCEALTYGGLLDVLRVRELRFEGVSVDARGMVPAALDDVARRKDAKLVVLQPTVHNPTAAQMDLERRREIVAVARAHDLTLIEDDVYGQLPADRPPPIAALAPERTVYIASASKCLAPGLRVGWVIAPPALIERFADAMHVLALSQPPLPAEIFRRWVEDGTADRLAGELRAEVAARNAIANQVFAGLQLQSQPGSFHAYLYLPEPWRREEFAAACLQSGIRVVTAATFAVGRDPVPHAIRLSLTAVRDRNQLTRHLTTLRTIIDAGPHGRRLLL